MFRLHHPTPVEWVRAVEQRPLALLADHAHCELKAAASAQALLLRHTERRDLAQRLAEIAVEEMQHFELVLGVLHARGGTLGPAPVNAYAEALLAASARSRRLRLLDRLVVAALIEARSFERFQLLAEHLADDELRELYRGLMASEAAHRGTFLRFARELFPAEAPGRIEVLTALEGEVVAGLPFDCTMHSGAPLASSPALPVPPATRAEES